MENKIDKIKAGAVMFSKGVTFVFYTILAVTYILVLLATVLGPMNIEQISLVEAVATIIISIIIAIILSILFTIDIKQREFGLAGLYAFAFVLLAIFATVVIKWSLKIFFGLVVNSPLWAMAIIVISMIGALLLILGIKWQDEY